MEAEAPARQFDLTEFAAALLSQREVGARARLIVTGVAHFFPDTAFVLYVLEHSENVLSWQGRATIGDVRVDAHAVREMESFENVLTRGEPLLYEGSVLSREAYAHLDLRRSVTSWSLVPLAHGGKTSAVLELISFSNKLSVNFLEGLSEVLEIAALGIASAVDYEAERNSQLASISRITQFYDLEKTFNSSIEIEELLPLIASKFREILDAQAVNLWMVQDKDTLLLTNRGGDDPTTEIESVQALGEGVAFVVSESGEPVLITDAEDERLRSRNERAGGRGVRSLMAVPLTDRTECVGVAEVVNKRGGSAFDEDDLFLLTTIAETASGALHNAGLLQTERKAQVLEALVEVSNEITSTLNLDRVLQTVVNGAQAVIPFERSAIGLEQYGRLQLRAVSGMRQVNFAEPSVIRLRDFMEWLSFSTEEINVKQVHEEITGAGHDREEYFREYFAHTGVRAFYARPLADDQGRLGLLVYESSDADFLNPAHIELIKILAGQATVALRNAQLYQEVPFIQVLEPILHRKRRFMAMEKSRRVATYAAAAVVAALFVIVPAPLRVQGDVTVAPTRSVQVQPEFDGVIKRVLVHEGEFVSEDTVLAEMDDSEFKRLLADAQAKYSTAISEMDRALAANDGSAAGIQRANVTYWNSEVQRARERVERTKLRSPIAGVVTTPSVEDLTGRRLEAGQLFAEIADTSHATVDVGVSEEDLPLIREGLPAAVKLQGYPTQTFRGKVDVVSPKSEASGDSRIFFARVDVPNERGLIRPGMQGEAKVSTGWHPAGYVLFRRPAMWVWTKLWSWFGV
jgi:RND family efflux transporter MFP subunit